MKRFWKYVNKKGPYPDPKKYPKLKTRCWLWIGAISGKRYGATRYKGKQIAAHRLAWFLKTGKWPAANICHACDNQLCVRHLFDASQAVNIADRDAKGHTAKGSKHYRAKLTEKVVAKIRKQYAAGGVTQKELGEVFGMSQAGIQYITSNRNWKHTQITSS